MKIPRWFPRLQFVLVCVTLFFLGVNNGRPFMPWWLGFILGVSTGSMIPYIWSRLTTERPR